MERAALLRFVPAAVSLVALAICSDAFAQQSSARYGTWKMNVARSTSTNPPKSLVRIDEPWGDGVKVTYEGVEADGSRIAYFYTARYDGKEYRPTGIGMGNGWQTIALRRIDDFSWDATLRRAGTVVSQVRVVVARDGKTMTQTVTVTDANGQPRRSTSVWEKQ